MRKIILNLAISIDGFIADVDGGFQWIQGDGDSSQNTERFFDFQGFVNTVDTIVMGSKAYEDCPKETIESFKDKKLIVATTRELESDGILLFLHKNPTIKLHLDECTVNEGITILKYSKR